MDGVAVVCGAWDCEDGRDDIGDGNVECAIKMLVAAAPTVMFAITAGLWGWSITGTFMTAVVCGGGQGGAGGAGGSSRIIGLGEHA